MYLPPLKKIQTGDAQLDKIQENVKVKTDQFDSLPFSSGRILELSVTTAATEFNHLLNKTPIGWIVLDIDANATVWRTASFNNRTIALQASSSANIKVWVF